jgi:hypothetical protein
MGSGLTVIALVGALGLLSMGMGGRRVRPRATRARPDPPGWLRERPPHPAEAERRSLELLRSVVNADEWEMFRDLGFICVTGRRRSAVRAGGPDDAPRHRYLIYAHLPVVALLPRSMAPVREYCVRFPDRRAPGGPATLPAGDDVLAKWMTLRADEDRLLSFANVAGAGCQVPLDRIERDLVRLERWRARRAAQKGAGGS